MELIIWPDILLSVDSKHVLRKARGDLTFPTREVWTLPTHTILGILSKSPSWKSLAWSRRKQIQLFEIIGTWCRNGRNRVAIAATKKMPLSLFWEPLATVNMEYCHG